MNYNPFGPPNVALASPSRPTTTKSISSAPFLFDTNEIMFSRVSNRALIESTAKLTGDPTPSGITMLGSNSNGPHMLLRPLKPHRRTCSIVGCTNGVVQGGLCVGHGAKRRTCRHPGCSKNSKNAGLCSKHGPARKRCDYTHCANVAVRGGRCKSHGASSKNCSVQECTKVTAVGGMCKKHHFQIKSKNTVRRQPPRRQPRKELSPPPIAMASYRFAGEINGRAFSTPELHAQPLSTHQVHTHKASIITNAASVPTRLVSPLQQYADPCVDPYYRNFDAHSPLVHTTSLPAPSTRLAPVDRFFDAHSPSAYTTSLPAPSARLAPVELPRLLGHYSRQPHLYDTPVMPTHKPAAPTTYMPTHKPATPTTYGYNGYRQFSGNASHAQYHSLERHFSPPTIAERSAALILGLSQLHN